MSSINPSLRGIIGTTRVQSGSGRGAIGTCETGFWLAIAPTPLDTILKTTRIITVISRIPKLAKANPKPGFPKNISKTPNERTTICPMAPAQQSAFKYGGVFASRRNAIVRSFTAGIAVLIVACPRDDSFSALLGPLLFRIEVSLSLAIRLSPSYGGRLYGPKAFVNSSVNSQRLISVLSQAETISALGPNSLITCRHAPQGAVGSVVGV